MLGVGGFELRENFRSYKDNGKNSVFSINHYNKSYCLTGDLSKPGVHELQKVRSNNGIPVRKHGELRKSTSGYKFTYDRHLRAVLIDSKRNGVEYQRDLDMRRQLSIKSIRNKTAGVPSAPELDT